MSNFKKSPPSYLDQDYTYRAIESFQLFLDKYPQSKRKSEVNQKVDELTRKLEFKMYMQAKLFYQMGEYKSSAVFFDNLLVEFPDTEYAEEVNYLIAESQFKLARKSIESKQIERYKKSVGAVKVFNKKYKTSYYNDRISEIEKKSQEEILRLKKDLPEYYHKIGDYDQSISLYETLLRRAKRNSEKQNFSLQLFKVYHTKCQKANTQDKVQNYEDLMKYYNDLSPSNREHIKTKINKEVESARIGYYNYKFEEQPNSISQTQYAVDAYWLDYVTSIAAGVDPAVYDATAYCPPFCSDHLGYPYLYYASYTEFNEQEETSLYGQFDYNVNDKLTLTLGIRDYEIEDASKTYQYGIFYMDSTGCDGTDPAGTDCAELSGSESDTRMKYAVSYLVNEDLTLYATQAAGYRPGGNQAPLPPFCSSDEAAQANFSRRFNSDEAETTEFGVKARGENYTANVTYFDVDWDGIIIQVTPGCGWRYNFNGGKAETSGWEVDFTYAINDSVSLDFAGSSMTAETSIDIDSLGASAGDRLPNTVETQWNLGLVYDTTIMSYPTYARLDVNYYGDSFNTFAENPNSSSPDYTKLNFNLGLDLSENSMLQLSIDNLTDKRTEAYIYAVDDTSWRPRNWMQWIPPRTIALRYTYSF